MYRHLPVCRRPSPLCFWAFCLALFCLTVAAPGQDERKKPPADKPAATSETGTEGDAEAETAVVKKGTIRVDLDLEGVVEASVSREIAVRPDSWTAATGWQVRSVVPHGAAVKSDDVLLRFDTTEIDRAIADLQAELKLGALSLQQAEYELEALEKTTPMDLAASKRAAQIVQQDSAHYFNTQRPYDLTSTEYRLKSAKNSLEYAEEELEQLEKMYEADDLTEETEAIVLKRARNSVEAAKMSLAGAQIRHDLALKYSIPREDEQVRERSKRNEVETERTRITLPLNLQKQRLEVRKLREQQRRSEEKLAKLEADRKLMTVKSPTDGYVYYGKSTRGKFSDAVATAETLRPHGKVAPNKVLLTVVRPQPFSIRATVPEDKLYRVSEGLAGTVTPKAYPRLKLPAVVQRASKIPISPGSFEAHLRVRGGRQADAVMPGMACTVKLVPYLNREALYLPPKAVHTEEGDRDESYVYVQTRDGKAVRRAVTLGEKNEKQAEILKGLAEGDRVLLKAPEE